MLRINGAYLYETGGILKAIKSIPREDSKRISIYFPFLHGKQRLTEVLYQSLFSHSLRSSAQTSSALLEQLNYIAPDPDKSVSWDEVIPSWRIEAAIDAFAQCETVLKAEFESSALYLATPKGGYDTVALTDFGESLFPNNLARKVPQAIPDIRAGTRCIAFELPTAAAFHFHRANESVLRRYFDEVAGENARPDNRSMGSYIAKMRDLAVGDEKVIGVLVSLKDLHRNPLMHPDQSIDNIEEAISLLSAIRAAIGYMLDRIPDDAVPPVVGPLPFNN